MSTKWALKGIVAAALAAVVTTGFTAQETRNLLVSATIPGGCALSLSGPMSFGNLNVASGSDETKSVTVTFKCAVGNTVSNFTVAGENDGSFTGSMLGNATAETLPYTITWTQPALPYTGTGFSGTGVTVQLNGLIRNVDYVSRSPDTYSQNVVVAILY